MSHSFFNRNGIHRRRVRPANLAFALALALTLGPWWKAAGAERWWSDGAQKALEQAGTNRMELTRAMEEVPVGHREGMQFLIEHMPEPDRLTLTAAFLLENVTLAYEMFEAAPWAKQVPKEIFLNEVLPYASLNEQRDNWRRLLIEKCRTMITNCATPAAAAQALNRRLFEATNVRYSTERRRADQGPLETMASGKATCTGLSILLVDACRALGVPARVTATPMWSNNRGNHTWVEIWDNGWHFTGAAEPDPKGLNRGWFRGEASQARKDEPRYAIYSSSFARTGVSFPLPWARGIAWVNAENVTDRYTALASAADTNRLRLEVKVIQRPGGPRAATRVVVTDQTEPTLTLEGQSRDESADLNDLLSFDVRRGRTYDVAVEYQGKTWRREFAAPAGTNRAEVLLVNLKEPRELKRSAETQATRSRGPRPLSMKEEGRLRKELAEYYAASTHHQAQWEFGGRLERLLAANEPAVRRLAWEVYKTSPIAQSSEEHFRSNRVQFSKHQSPYTVKTVGERPTNGWALFIAMHGGGNAPKAVNDNQWNVMQRYYHDHPEVGGYRYVALRAPNDTWNGFYDDYVYPLVANLIQQFLVFGDVDPNKVFIMGYSHGGYGAYAIGPKMPDRFAAIHASAAAATDGETTPKNLRNTIFTAMVGEKDTAYGRYDRNRRFKEAIEQLRGGRHDVYPVTVDIIAGHGHSGLPDRDKIVSMYPAVRQPAPRELTWLQTDKVIQDFFWLQVAEPAKNQEIYAECADNRVTVTTTTNVPSVVVYLDERLVKIERPVVFTVNGKTSSQKLKPSLQVLAETMMRRGDPELAFTTKAEFPIAKIPPPAPRAWAWFGLRSRSR